MSKFIILEGLLRRLNGTAKAAREWEQQAGKLAIRQSRIPFVRPNPVTDTTHAWVRKAERQANQAKRQVYSQSIQAIPESAKVYSKSGKSFTVAPQYTQILNWNRQTAYNKIKDQAIEKRAQQIRNNRLKFGGIGLGILGTLPIAYNITSNKISGADENLNDQTSRIFDALWGNTFGTRGHGSSDYKILKEVFKRQCAAYSNDHLRKEGANIYKNAWNFTVGQYLSGYEGLKRPNKNASYQELQNYNYNAADNLANKLDTTTLNRNLDYPVNLYYSDSPYAREAFNDGTQGRTGSHTGYLRSINGSWKLIHNVHQNVRQNNLPDVLGSKNETGITWIGKGVPATADV